MFCLNYFESFADDLECSELCGIYYLLILLKTHVLNQMNVRDCVQLESNLRNFSYSFMQAEYCDLCSCYFKLLYSLSFSSAKTTKCLEVVLFYENENFIVKLLLLMTSFQYYCEISYYVSFSQLLNSKGGNFITCSNIKHF